MAKPWNDKAENDIRRIAHQQLIQQGYKKTSYQTIANDLGTNRAFVQHYLQRKEDMLVTFLEELLSLVDQWVTGARPEVDDQNLKLVLGGQVYFAFLFDPKVKTLALDILESRKITEVVIPLNERYQVSHSQENDEEVSDEITRVVGGSYELAYKYLSSGRVPDPLRESMHIVNGYLRASGIDDCGFDARASDVAFSREEICAALDWLYESFSYGSTST
jgi:AcrR family transcriptional regulator